MINISNLSSVYEVKRLRLEDIDEILKLYETNTMYFSLFNELPSKETVKEDLLSLPKGKTNDDKYYIGLYLKDTLICIIDMIEAYPNSDDVYIGLFMMNILFQGNGIGTSIIYELSIALSDQGFKYIKLAYLENNLLAKAFWMKNGFMPNGKTGEYKGHRVIELERKI